VETRAKVAGGFISAAENHPGGLGGLLWTMKNNGLGDHVNNWTTGQTTQVNLARWSRASVVALLTRSRSTLESLLRL